MVLVPEVALVHILSPVHPRLVEEVHKVELGIPADLHPTTTIIIPMSVLIGKNARLINFIVITGMTHIVYVSTEKSSSHHHGCA